MNFAAFLAVTMCAHGAFALLLVGHARYVDRDAGNWPYLTLAVGVVGVAGYLLTDTRGERSIRRGRAP